MKPKQTIEKIENIIKTASLPGGEDEPIYISEEDLQALDHAINCVGAIEQIKWERDIAIQQLNELGYQFGEKIREEDKRPSTLEQLKVLKSSCEKNGIDVSLETFLEDKVDKE